MQRERFAKHATVCTNSAMTPCLLKKHCELDAGSLSMLEHVMTEHGFSARAHDHILKVARTIADLSGEEKITEDHVFQAVSFRSLDRKFLGVRCSLLQTTDSPRLTDHPAGW